MSRSRAPTVEQIVAEPGGALAPLLARARRLAGLERTVLGLLESPLAAHCRVANLRGETLVLHADSPVWATRLRYQAPALLERLRHLAAAPELAGLAAIVVRVRPPAAATAAPGARVPKLTQTSAETIRSVALGLDEGRLRAALLRLAGRADGSTRR